MKYKLNCYGWSAEIIAKDITDEQLNQIKKIFSEKEAEDFTEIRLDIQDAEIIDIWSGDIFHFTKAFGDEKMLFVLEDENNNKVLEFGISDTASIEDMIDDYDDYTSYELIPDENRHQYLSIDENKGGIYSFEFESDEVPKASDFACAPCSIDTPDDEFDFIDSIYFKGQKLEPIDYLDNSGKAASVYIYEFEK